MPASPCPNCGYCPHCGRAAAPYLAPTPQWWFRGPTIWPWPVFGDSPYPTTVTCSGGTATITKATT